MPEKPRILFFANLDSQVFGCLGFIDHLNAMGFECCLSFGDSKKISPELKQRVAKRARIVSVGYRTLEDLEPALGYDAVCPSLSGSQIAQISLKLRTLEDLRGSRPLVFSIYNGVVLGGFEEGLAWRLGADIVCLNSDRDMERARHFLGSDCFQPERFIVTGLLRENPAPVSGGLPEQTSFVPQADTGAVRKKTALFAEQVAIPREKHFRIWLFRQLNELARHNPDWRVVIKPRVRQGEQTFHKQIYHPSQFKGYTASNLDIDYSPLPEILPRVDLVISISSTMLIDALLIGKPIAVINEFGFRDADGTHVFAGAGVSCHLFDNPDLDELASRKPSEEWVQQFRLGSRETILPLVKAIEGWRGVSDGDVHAVYSPAFLEHQQRLRMLDATSGNRLLQIAAKVGSLLPELLNRLRRLF
ncbi:DUF6716 putative glycosyltransferase [Coralliovum pocilloporae]|uniref:DUF6716 putative glycosyltransferase n=1 Tax=Coralliovum pocilloporae TaxID=3066369 RepID=UPI003307A8CD